MRNNLIELIEWFIQKYSYWLVILGGLLVVLYSSLFSVKEDQKALVIRFGDIKRVVDNSGLHFKVPFVDEVLLLSNRLLNVQAEEQEAIAADQKRLVVDLFAKYKIHDPVLFYKAFQNNRNADSRLLNLMLSSTRQVLGKESFIGILSKNRQELMIQIKTLMNNEFKENGIEIVDVRVKKTDLPAANSDAIYRRMKAERAKEAAQIRAQGEEQSKRIRANADKEVSILLSEAKKDSEIIKGEGDLEAAKIYALAYGKDPEFYSFYRSLGSYEKALDDNTTFILDGKSPYLKHFRK